ncbi:hypothetical protein FRC96_17410 [Lujinxingia vulgaris]|uniref:Uncharacterized protein n=1 Tax=Lujinxingia vulgaris TaxID=2600176 RepID=A0A5C6WZ88_9DELT|nr:hypothetical protein [Lujinxingia vulgaris]TXD32472.1 hypothetical protein FRC96_17410 [Lujinxingia vulgaris]
MTPYQNRLQNAAIGVILLAMISGFAACASSGQERGAQRQPGAGETLIGRPPPAEGDPFLRAALPPDAQPAEARGRIQRADPRTPACFSCVKLCAPGDLTPECSNSPEDLICGWGAHPDDIAAKERARAQCEATLDLARKDKGYPIEGQCPPATCW